MENKEAANSLSFGVSLCEQAVYHLDFLKSVDRVPELKNPKFLRRALFRYEKYWLPLAADHPGECLVAPLDIEWIWHCHMLSPMAYEVDCQSVVGKTVNHTLYTSSQALDQRSKSREYWLQKYNECEVPFDIDFAASLDQEEGENLKSKISYDIVAAAKRQATFYYQVSLPHFRDSKFLESCVLRYKQFLYMKTKVAQDFLVPCYDIDLIWHTHQLNPVAYKEDTVRIIGYLFNHDDTDNDRSDGSKLDNAGKQTSENWKHFYDEDFSQFGAMYRGKPPNGRLKAISQEDAYKFSTKKYKVTFEKLTLTFPTGRSVKSLNKILLRGSSTKSGKVCGILFSLTRKTASSSKGNALVWSDVESFELDTKCTEGISFEFHQWKGRACFVSEVPVAFGEMDIPSLISNGDNIDTNVQRRISTQISLGSSISVDIEGNYSVVECKKADLFLRKKLTLLLKVCSFETVVLPEDVQQLLGPVDIERRPSGANNFCQTATHRFVNRATDVEEFTVKVIHSTSLMTSVIQVFYHDKMAAIAHLIASDQLPLPTQVDDGVITLNPRQGERAVLIKNDYGDWAVVTGRWQGFKRGKAGTSCFRAEYGSPGSLTAKVYKFSSGITTSITYPFYKFKLDSCEVDLRRIIEIDTTANETAENIALAFTVALLHVLCVPRPKGWKEGESIEPEVNMRGKKSITPVPSYEIAFIMAAGLLRTTPTNYFISNLYGNQCAIIRGHVMKCDGEWQNLLGEGDHDAGCDGCACSGRDDRNCVEFDSGIIGAGCGGCGGHACASTCGGGKGACSSDYKGYKSSSRSDNPGSGSGDTTSASAVAFDASNFLTDGDFGGGNDACGSGDSGGGFCD